MPDVPWFLYAIPLAMIGLIAFAALYKYMQVREAARWPSAQGKIVVSSSERRSVKTFDDDKEGGTGTEDRNFAKIVYEYTARGQKLRGSRVSIGEDLGNFEVAETIARYPVGKIVTVYYNPRKPGEAVLERDPPKGLWGCVIAMVVVGVIGIFGSFFGFNQLTQFVKSQMTNPDRAPMVVALSAMGLFAMWFGFALRRQANAAKGWPQVTARINRSEVDEFQGKLTDDKHMRTLYRPLISYSYEYSGVKYAGNQVSLGAKVTSGSDGFAKRIVAKYPVGKIFKVYVNPENASESVLQPAVAGAWLVWGAAAFLWGLAYFISQQP